MAISKRRLLFRSLAGIAIAMVGLVLAGWIAFVPSAKEPSYEFVMAWGEQGSGPGQFNDPTGIAIANGEVFVADSRNARIQVFDRDGTFKRAFGEPGDSLGQLGRPMNLAIHDGKLYVPEYFNDRIQIFGLDGTAKRIIGGPGNGPGEFNAPGGVAVGENGHLFVADFYNHRVQELKADGTFVRQWGTTGEPGIWGGEFTYPTDTALAAEGALLRGGRLRRPRSGM
jgi:DNA-binding beta-propeller fold protein YncE